MKQSIIARSNAVQQAVKPFVAMLAAAVALLVLASCAQIPMLSKQEQATPDPVPEPTPAPTLKAQEKPKSAKTLWEWNGDGRTVSHIWVDIDNQRVRFYDGSEQIGWSYIASGLKSYPTPVGTFEVIEKNSKKRSNLYGKIYNASGKVVKSNAKQGKDRIPPGGSFRGAKMPYFMRLTYDGIGLHAGRIPNPGSPASHGCIRMPKAVAPVLYKHVSIGTPVTITGNGPNYGNYAQKQRTARAARLAAERERAKADALIVRNTQVAPSVAATHSAQVARGVATAQYAPVSAAQDVPVIQQAPAPQSAPVVQQAPAPQNAPVVQQAPVPQSAPVVQEKTPTVQDAPTLQGPPATQTEAAASPASNAQKTRYAGNP